MKPDSQPGLPETPRLRGRRPVCGILAWGLPLLAVPIGILLAYLADRGKHYEGFQGWAILGWLFFPLVLAVPTSFILAIVALCRRERYPSLTITLVVFYAVGLAFGTLEGLALLVVFIAGLALLATWLIWRHRRKRSASGTGTTLGK